MPKRYVRGDRSFGRLLKRLPDDVTAEIRSQLNQTGRMLLALARRRVPVAKGNLRAGLSYYIPPVRLQLKVGLVGKATNRKLFYGHIVEFGNKAKTVWVVRGGLHPNIRAAGGRSNNYKALAKAMGVGYELRVPARPPRHFVYVATRDQIYAPYRAIWNNALGKAGTGASDD